jgi:opacity protein-like surface antigen
VFLAPVFAALLWSPVFGDYPLKKVQLFLILLVCTAASAHGQAHPTASRLGDLQVGGTFTIARPDYLTNRIHGYGFYADFDFRPHWGAEVEFHQLNDPTTQPIVTQVYERTYEFGGRYLVCHCSRFTPYAKALYGRGVYNFSQSQANLAYNMGVAAAGVDIAVHPRVNVRLDYEYQHWFGFQFSGLNPQLFTVGAAYHFGAGKPH